MKRIISAVLCVVLLMGLASCKKGEQQTQTTTQPQAESIFCTADEGKITVLSLDAASGLFVEKGKQDNVSGVATIVVRNDSGKMLEYGKIVFRVNDCERAEFIVNALPNGAQCVVMETTARPLADSDTYKINITDSMFSYCEASTESELYTLAVEGSTIKITNNTKTAMTVNVAYKYFKDDKYYGGIAFRGTFENIAPGETMSQTSNRFNSDCRIVNITTV